jgi:hypothetical protein
MEGTKEIIQQKERNKPNYDPDSSKPKQQPTDPPFKMKLLNLAALTTALLAPTVCGDHTSTVRLTNTFLGPGANRDIPEDGVKRSVAELWANSDIVVDGVVKASSAMFNKFQQDSVCHIWQDKPAVDATLTARHTWTWLDEGPWWEDGDVVPLDNAYIKCWTT